MTSKIIANGILKAIAMLLAVGFLLVFLFKIQSVLIYIVIASVISLIARPLIRFLKKRLKFPNTLAVFISMFLFLCIILGLVGMFIPLIAKQGENLSLLNSEQFKQNVEHIVQQINQYFLSKNINLLNEIKDLDLMSNFKEIPNLLNALIGTLGSLTIGLFSVLFISFFLMKDNLMLHNAIFTLIPDKNESRFSKSFDTIKDLLSRYFIGLIIQITVLFVIYTIVLSIFGIEHAIVIAFLCALLNLIPYIGPLIGGVIMFVLTMTSNLGLDFQTEILPTTMKVMFGYFIAQLIDNFLSQPIIFSKSVKSHPLEIFLVIIIGGLLFGIIGMVVAVPVYTAIKVILKEFLTENKIVKSLTKDL